MDDSLDSFNLTQNLGIFEEIFRFNFSNVSIWILKLLGNLSRIILAHVHHKLGMEMFSVEIALIWRRILKKQDPKRYKPHTKRNQKCDKTNLLKHMKFMKGKLPSTGIEIKSTHKVYLLYYLILG